MRGLARRDAGADVVTGSRSIEVKDQPRGNRSFETQVLATDPDPYRLLLPNLDGSVKLVGPVGEAVVLACDKGGPGQSARRSSN